MINDIDKSILQQLIDSQDYISGSFLAKSCNVSINTIRKEIDIINEYLKDYDSYIDSKISVGYLFVQGKTDRAKKFVQSFVISSKRFSYLDDSLSKAYYFIMRLLSTPEGIPLEQLADELNISKSTASRNLDLAKEALLPYQLEIRTKRNVGLYIEGNEFYIRLCAVVFHKIYKNSQLIEKTDQDFADMLFTGSSMYFDVRNAVYTVLNRHHRSMSSLYCPKVVNMIIVNATRKRYEKNITFTPVQISTAKASDCFPIAQEIYNMLPPFFAGYNEMDITIIAMMLSAYITIHNFNEIPLSYQGSAISESAEMVSFVSKYYAIPSEMFSEAIVDFAPIMYQLSIRKLYGILSDTELESQTFSKGLSTNGYCACFALFYLEKNGIKLTPADLCEVYVAFNNYMLKYKHKLLNNRVLLCCRDGYLFGTNLANRILSRFGTFIECIDVFETNELYYIDMTKYNLILTDLTEYDFAYLAPQAKICSITFYREKNDFRNFFDYLKQEILDSVLMFFKKGNIHRTSFSNLEDVYQFYYKCYENEFGNYKTFLKDIKLRNSFIPMVRDNGLVITTTLALRAKDPSVDMILNDKPININGTDVSVFIFYQPGGDGNRTNTLAISRFCKKYLYESAEYLKSLYLKDDQTIFDELVSTIDVENFL